MALFDRTDFRLLRVFLVVVAVLAPVALILVPVAFWVAGSPLTWTGPTGETSRSLARLVEPASGVRLTWDGTARVSLPDADADLWLVTLLTRAVLAAAVMAVALLLRRVVGEIQVGRPFTPASLRDLRVVGLVMIGAAVVVPFTDGLASLLVMHRAVADAPLSLSLDFNPMWLLGGALFLAMAEAFRAGAALADDVEGLV